jgi:tetratricopeptide (TPR) repeat protein
MAQDIHSFIERYQLLYEKDPKSKVFAPLAEAYRRMGLIDEAIDLAERGVREHPHFASGRVALGKCYVQKAKYAEGAAQLKVAAELSPENLLAHQLLAECYTRLDKPVEALNAYKIVLFLNPNDARVSKIVIELETQIYAGSSKGEFKDLEFVEEEYSMGRLSIPEKDENSKTMVIAKNKDDIPEEDLERNLALLDIRSERADWDTAKIQLQDLLKKFPQHPEVLKRKDNYEEVTQSGIFSESTPIGEDKWKTPEELGAATIWTSPLSPEELNPKVKMLEKLLARIEDRSKKA